MKYVACANERIRSAHREMLCKLVQGDREYVKKREGRQQAPEPRADTLRDTCESSRD